MRGIDRKCFNCLCLRSLSPVFMLWKCFFFLFLLMYISVLTSFFLFYNNNGLFVTIRSSVYKQIISYSVLFYFLDVLVLLLLFNFDRCSFLYHYIFKIVTKSQKVSTTPRDHTRWFRQRNAIQSAEKRNKV